MPSSRFSSPSALLVGLLLALVVRLLLAVPLSAQPANPNKLGVHLLLDDGRNVWPVERWREHLEYARRAVGEWGFVTELVRGDDLNPARWQVFMDLCAELHLTPILRFATTFDRAAGWWNAPTTDADGSYRSIAADLAFFVVALRWPTDAHYVIIGNEPNHGDEWGGRADPAAYARFLVEMASALHASDPQARVLNAGFDPFTPNTGSQPFMNGMYYLDAESFMDGMIAARPDVFRHIDVWASHSYPLGPLTDGPWSQTFQVDLINDASNPNRVSPPLGVNNRGVNGYEFELYKLSTYGITDLPVLITETGWRHAESTDPGATDNGRPLPPAQTVAEYLDLALRGNQGRYAQYPSTGWTPWLDDPRVIAVTPFAFNGLPAEWGHTNWLMLDSAGNVQGTYPPFNTLEAIHGSR